MEQEKENTSPISLDNVPDDVLNELVKVGERNVVERLIFTPSATGKEMQLWKLLYEIRFVFKPPYWFTEQLSAVTALTQRLDAYRNLYKWTDVAVNNLLQWDPLITIKINNEVDPTLIGNIVYKHTPILLEMGKRREGLSGLRKYKLPMEKASINLNTSIKSMLVIIQPSNVCRNNIAYVVEPGHDNKTTLLPIPEARVKQQWFATLETEFKVNLYNNNNESKLHVTGLPSFKSIIMFLMESCPEFVVHVDETNSAFFYLSLFFYDESDYQSMKEQYHLNGYKLTDSVQRIFQEPSWYTFPKPPPTRHQHQSPSTKQSTKGTALRRMRDCV